MELKLKVFSSLCTTEEFVINGIKADEDDFGETEDASPDTAEAYGCGDMTFYAKEPTAEILEKYRITEEEYHKITEELTKKLSFGSCGCCI